jgi:hypothetical protein
MAESLSKWHGNDVIGGAWLSATYGFVPVQPLRFTSTIGPSRSSRNTGNLRSTQFTEQYRPEPTLRAHLEFMMRYERISLEFLARLFAVTGPDELLAWIKEEPTGRYARRACFYFELLTGTRLEFEGVLNGGYVDALEEDRYWTASKGENDRRWRVRNNLPGNHRFCPIVLLTDRVREAIEFDFAVAWGEMEREFSKELLARSAVWLTLKESRASFAVEGEGDKADRVHRFAAAMESQLGRHRDIFEPETVEMLQREVLGNDAAFHGLRKSPIFVGQTRSSGEIVHYIAPDWQVAQDILAGLSSCDEVTADSNSILRATALSFGFVYAHPLTDGNGRISRFIINDVLRRARVIPEPFVLPVSAVILSSMHNYDRALERLSRPLMRRYAGAYWFGERVRYEDGRTSDFHFNGYKDAAPTWRYPDLTDHVEYLADVIRVTLNEEMRTEAREMRAFRDARAAIKEVFEAPDPDVDRIIRSVSENRWAISGKLLEEFPKLARAEVAEGIVGAVRNSFEGNGGQGR